MYLTAIHEIHLGKRPDVIVPGAVFKIDEAEGARLVALGAAQEPTEAELILSGVKKAEPSLDLGEPKKRGRPRKVEGDATDTTTEGDDAPSEDDL